MGQTITSGRFLQILWPSYNVLTLHTTFLIFFIRWAIFQMLFWKIDHCGGPSALDCRRKLILIIAAKQTELFSIMCTPKTFFRMSLFYWELVKLNPKNGKNLDLDFWLGAQPPTSVVLTDQKRTAQILRAKTLRVLRQS